MSISKFPGGLITKTPVTPSGPYETSTAPGVWTMTQVANYVKQGLWPTSGNQAPDPYFEYVTMLLHGDGTNGGQNNTFLDSSTNNFSITRNGSSTQGSVNPYGSLWSAFFPSENGYNLQTPDGAGSVYRNACSGTNYTIEFWVNRSTRTGANQCMHSAAADSNNFVVNSSNNLLVRSNGSTLMFTVAADTYIPVGVWTHVALVCADTTWTLYFNGVSYGTYSGANKTWGGGGANGVQTGGRNDMNGCGYLSNFRISTVARYSSNFTPPTAAFNSDASTALLLCGANRFIDASPNNVAVTFGQIGGGTIYNFAPFNPTAAYSTATNGGSGLFGPAGISNLRILPTGLSSMSTWTMEFWAYNSAGQTDQAILGPWTPNLIRDSNGDFQIYLASALKFSSIAWTKNQWNHVALSNDGTSLRFYLNGVLRGTAGSTTIDLSDLVIGSETTNSTTNDVWNGYISNFRVLNGTALYSGSTITVPSAPLTAIANTSLLLNFTNGAIFDNSTKNNLQTVGNAQISTSVVKFGTGSISIPGGGANAFIPSSPNLDMGTGAFTVECWVNSTSIAAAYPTFISSVTGWSAGASGHRFNNTGAANRFTFHLNGAGDPFLTSTNTFSFGVWYHYALTRSGDTWRMFINGNLEASGTYSAAFNQALGGMRLGYSQWDGTNGYYNGYIDDLRITKGYARYTANFTPPTQAFQNL